MWIAGVNILPSIAMLTASSVNDNSLDVSFPSLIWMLEMCCCIAVLAVVLYVDSVRWIIIHFGSTKLWMFQVPAGGHPGDEGDVMAVCWRGVAVCFSVCTAGMNDYSTKYPQWDVAFIVHSFFSVGLSVGACSLLYWLSFSVEQDETEKRLWPTWSVGEVAGGEMERCSRVEGWWISAGACCLWPFYTWSKRFKRFSPRCVVLPLLGAGGGGGSSFLRRH